jgi:hypothetical protein
LGPAQFSPQCGENVFIDGNLNELNHPIQFFIDFRNFNG